MRNKAEPPAKAREPLNRDRVLRAALALADTAGIESLSMRNLGQKLGVEAMSLYNHVAGKEDILDGIADLVFGEIVLPSGQADWKTAMRERASSAREALVRHPWAASLMLSRATPGPATLRHHDSVIGTLRGAGFSMVMVAHTLSVLDGYIYGFALQQVNLLVHTPEEVAQVGGSILEQMAGEYPYLAAMITDHAMQPGYEYSDEFEFGLDLILDGLERSLRRRSS